MIKTTMLMLKRAVLGLVLSLTAFVPAVSAVAQAPYSNNTNAVFTPVVFTATSQTSAPISFGGPSGSGNSYAVGNLAVTGVALTTATFSVQGSSDGGVTYTALPVNLVSTPATTTTTTTVTVAGVYQVNLAGFTNIRFVTSGTFTATSLSIVLTASPNGVIARLGSGTGLPSAPGANYAPVSTAAGTGSYTAQLVPWLSSQSAYSVFGNFTDSSAAPTFSTSPVFDGSGLTGITVSQVANAAATNTTNTFTAAQTAPAFWPQHTSAGPYAGYLNDFFSAADMSFANIGSATASSCAISVTAQDQNHPGNLLIYSGTAGSATGEVCYLAGPLLATGETSIPWTFESVVFPAVLPGTTAGSYQAGLTNASGVSPWTTGIGFYLSSANGTPNNWYCEYSTTYTNSAVTAATAWTRLSIVSDGTYIHWYINGTQVCGTGVAIANMPSTNQYFATTSVAGSATGVRFYLDYILFEQAVTR